MKVRVMWLVVALIVGCGLSGCLPGSTPLPDPTPTFWPTPVVPEKPTYTVERGTVVDSLKFTARVAPVHEEQLYFRTDGRVLEAYVQRGDAVRTGDRLAELDVEALYRQLARAELDLASAKTDLVSAETDRADDLARALLDLELERVALEKLRGHDLRADLAVVKAELEAARVSLARAQANYDRVAHVPDIALRPEAIALQDATLVYQRAQAAHDQAVRDSEKDSDLRSFDLETQQILVDLAQLEVDRLAQGVDPRLEQMVTKAELALGDLQAQITDTLIIAPFDGEISALSTAAGKAVEGFRPVLVLADPAELKVSAELEPDEMRKLSEGQAATVVPIEVPGEEMPATIRLLPYPYGSGGSAVGLEDEDQSTHLEVDWRGLELETGDLVRATVVLEQKDDALWLPPAAIRTFGGRKFVVIKAGAGQQQVDVSLGIESEDRVEILTGLEEGQVVLGR